jgi:hypothetical protein
LRARRNRLVLAGALVLLLALGGLARADFGSPVTITSSGADPFGYPSHVGFSRSGETTVETLGGGGNVLVFVRPPGGSFSGGSIGTGTRASMAEAPSGAAVLAWIQSGGLLNVAYRGGAGAPFAVVTSFTGGSISGVAAGIDSNGNAVVAWKDGAIHYALSNGATFGANQTAGPLGSAPGFVGKGSDPQRDRGPRAFRDDAGNVALVYRDGTAATLAERSPSGTWTTRVLPNGSASTDISADADPVTQHLIIGYTTTSQFFAFVGSTATTAGAVRVNQPAASANISSVAVRKNGNEDLAVWRDAGNALKSASCMENYNVASVAPAAGAGVVALVTSGEEELAFYPGGSGLSRSSRAPGAAWQTTDFSVSNYGTLAGGSGYSGEALGLFVDFPNDTGLTGFPYTGTATPRASCATASLPAPVLGKTFNVGVIKTPVRVELPGTKKFVPLTDARQLRFGTLVDVTNGRVQITIATGHGLDTIQVYGGEFLITQSRGSKLANLILEGGNFSGCARAPRRPHLSGSPTRSVRHLWASGKGHFRTVGRFSSATIRGTTWDTDDRCDGTLTRVTAGKVAVLDFVKRRTVVVRAHHQYLAR